MGLTKTRWTPKKILKFINLWNNTDMGPYKISQKLGFNPVVIYTMRKKLIEKGIILSKKNKKDILTLDMMIDKALKIKK
jgi:hypothetical protein